MSANLKDCHPELLSRFRRVQEACSVLGLMIEPTQGFRSPEEQDALYAQGRTKPGNVVTRARGGESYHNYGRAIDFAFRTSDGKFSWDEKLPWACVGRMGEVVGLEWGGRWPTPDKPHFEWKGDGFTLPPKKKAAILVG